MASDAAAAADGSFLLMTPHINEMSNIMRWQIEKSKSRSSISKSPFCILPYTQWSESQSRIKPQF